ncbi:TetR/AcrR family transcriptional regulator [Aminobacter sp. SR38]|jgi:AcrR family transcriptional regulator|uniref:TetR/AcrR family transcriptional regulator n=1 Tax=Aminobacter TaxID=31988 RepID=UPI00177CB1E4|nr:TetR/AcrR family transcriptional regulator [Aminobacter sp. SR38]QOF70594.1 TetR/AcrR family transcriptional regulator [Aminobacter sp. SR38]
MAIDRRVVRTRTALYDALVALIRAKDYAAITVEDILDEANVGRSTFYAHFTSKDDLLQRSLERLRDLLVGVRQGALDGVEDGWDPARALFEHVGEYADVQAALAGGHGGAVLREAVDKVLADVLRQTMGAGPAGGLPRELVIQHMVATFNTTLRWWREHRPAMAPAEADALFRQLLLRGLPADVATPFIGADERVVKSLSGA